MQSTGIACLTMSSRQRPRPTVLTNVTLADLGELLLPIFHLLQADQWRISLAITCKTLCTEQRRLRPPVDKEISVWSTRTKASDAGWRVCHIKVEETNPNRPASTAILLADELHEVESIQVCADVTPSYLPGFETCFKRLSRLRLCRWRLLSLRSCKATATDILDCAFSATPLDMLTILTINLCEFDDAACANFAAHLECGLFPRLETVSLVGNRVGDQGARALAQAMKVRCSANAWPSASHMSYRPSSRLAADSVHRRALSSVAPLSRCVRIGSAVSAPPHPISSLARVAAIAPSSPSPRRRCTSPPSVPPPPEVPIPEAPAPKAPTPFEHLPLGLPPRGAVLITPACGVCRLWRDRHRRRSGRGRRQEALYAPPRFQQMGRRRRHRPRSRGAQQGSARV